MGIDVPAFGRRVDRPEDFAAERGQTFTVTDGFVVSSGQINNTTVHINQSGSRQFLLLANLSQRLDTVFTAQSDVQLGFRVRSGGQVTARVRANDEPLTETLPSLPIPDGFVIAVRLVNDSGSSVLVDTSFTIRQGQ
jgi:hypothetical protein